MGRNSSSASNSPVPLGEKAVNMDSWALLDAQEFVKNRIR